MRNMIWVFVKVKKEKVVISTWARGSGQGFRAEQKLEHNLNNSEVVEWIRAFHAKGTVSTKAERQETISCAEMMEANRGRAKGVWQQMRLNCSAEQWLIPIGSSWSFTLSGMVGAGAEQWALLAPALLRYKWHIIFCKFKGRTRWLDTFIYCRMMTTKMLAPLSLHISILSYLWWEYLRCIFLATF